VIFPLLEEIQKLAERVVEGEGIELVEVEFKEGRSRNLLRIFIDRPGGVTLDDCESVSRQLSALLDVKDLVKDAYILEVSSPGIDRPLRTDRDYQRALNRFLKVSFTNEKGEAEQLIGKLVQLGDREITLEQNGRQRKLDRNMIRRAEQEIMLGQPKKQGKRK